MTRHQIADFTAWSLLACGYICSAAFLYIYGSRLGWLTLPPEIKHAIWMFDVVLFGLIMGIAATQPKRLWFGVPLIMLLAFLISELTKADCIANVCVIAI
jgi:hypothetical protein